MKNIKKLWMVTILLCLLMTSVVYASDLSWERVQGHHDQGVLLRNGEISSSDSVHRYGRGEYLAEGMVEIINIGEGNIYVSIETYAYRNVDKIFHSAFVDCWNESRNDWVQVGYWDFETTREENGGSLSRLISEFTLTGYETGLYYRVRGLHGVELNDEIEACATRTHGVLITR